MRRREFILAGSDLLASAKVLLAGSIVVSRAPRTSELDLQSLEGHYTPTSDFFVRNHSGIPAASTLHSLTIAGEVSKPLVISPPDLRHLKLHKLGAVLECARNGTGPLALASNGLWEGLDPA